MRKVIAPDCVVIPSRADGEGPLRRSAAFANHYAPPESNARCFASAEFPVERSLAVCAARDDTLFLMSRRNRALRFAAVETLRLFKSLTREQRNTFIACFLGWALDA